MLTQTATGFMLTQTATGFMLTQTATGFMLTQTVNLSDEMEMNYKQTYAVCQKPVITLKLFNNFYAWHGQMFLLFQNFFIFTFF